MKSTADRFKENARSALIDAELQAALANAQSGFVGRRTAVVDKLPEFDTLRDEARAIKDHTIANLDFYLERFETKVAETGGAVHWCRTAEDACEAVLNICRLVGAMMWLGGSWRSWMMYSPRSVSTGVMPFSSRNSLMAISSPIIVLPLVTVFAPTRRQS